MRTLFVFLWLAVPSLAADWTVYLTHVGPFRLGMTLAEVRAVLSDRQARLENGIDDVPVSECSYVRSDRLPKDIGIMFAHGRIVRIDVFSGSYRTASGAAIGYSEEQIKSMYPGHIQVEPHHYTDGHYLNYSPRSRAERKYGIVFETDGGKVTSYRIGTRAAIALVEGCA